MATELPNTSSDHTLLTHYTCTLGTPEATCTLAGLLASTVTWTKGDQITLSGPLGSGKSVFARAFIRTFLGDQELSVPSPTFTLMQTYTQSTPRSFGSSASTLIHADFYRLHDILDLLSLGWEDETEEAIALIEWPTHVPGALGPNRLELMFSSVVEKPEERLVTISAYGNKKDILEFIKAAHKLLGSWADAHNHLFYFAPLDGDASTRHYVRTSLAPVSSSRQALLMMSPPLIPTPYSLQTHLAHDLRPFIAMSHGLRSLGLSAPEIYGVHEVAGILLVEDLGTELLNSNHESHGERLQEAIGLLAFLHGRECSETISYGHEGIYYVLPPYDRGALQTEVGVFLDWYLKNQEIILTEETQKDFFAAWEPLLMEVVRGPRTWTLRDYHSPNLLWLKNRHGRSRIGLLDFQDAVWGHPAYDLASLLQDARITIEPDVEKNGYTLYVQMRADQDSHFDDHSFSRAYAILAAQRATKVLGVFSRLIHRDGKTRYATHIPRVQAYLVRTLRTPIFDHLRPWYEAHTPTLFMNS